MSLLSAVLQEAGQASQVEFKQKSAELCPKLQELTERIQLYSCTLQETFVELYVRTGAAKSLEQNNFRTRKQRLFSDYEKFNNEARNLGEKCETSNDCAELTTCMKNLDKAFALLKDLCVALEVDRDLEIIGHKFRRYNYSEAIIGVEALTKQLKNLNFDGDSAKALENLKDVTQNYYAVYVSEVMMEWQNIFSWSEKKGLTFLTLSLQVQQSDKTLVEKVLKTLHEINLLHYALAPFANFFVNRVLDCIIKHNCNIFTDESLNSVIFNIQIDLIEDAKPSFQTIFNNLTAVFECLHTYMSGELENTQTFVSVLSESIAESFFTKLINDSVKPSLPYCEKTYVNYKNLVIELDSFNKFLIDIKFINAENSPLTKYMDNINDIFYTNKCERLLLESQNLFKESLSFNPVQVGSPDDNLDGEILDITVTKDWTENIIERPLFLPKCTISRNVRKVLRNIAEHLDEAVKVEGGYRWKLCSYINSIVELYLTMVPKRFFVNLENCPSDIALFFNNCFYLAHGLVSLAHDAIQPQDVACCLNTILLAPIQDLRMLGLNVLTKYLQVQKDKILMSVQPDEKSDWTYETYNQFDKAISNTITTLEDLKSVWFQVLPSKMYYKSMSELVGAMCQVIQSRIFCGTKVFEDEMVYMIACKIDDVIFQIEYLFKDTENINKKIKLWSKFKKLPVLLKGPLLEISELWSKDEEFPKCFTREEVRQAIKMRFIDNTYRMKILQEIQ